MNWIDLKLHAPKESDGLILVSKRGHALVEMAWFSEEDNELKKPFAFDEHDRNVFGILDITHWMKCPESLPELCAE